jgi:uncharacterized protein (TIGR03118 family)
MRGWFRSGLQALDGRSPQRRCSVRLTLERLEDRCLLSGGYLQTNLVSDVPGLANFTDPNLVNPWGLAAGPAGPFWVSDSGTGVSTLYDGQGQPQPSGSPLVVSIPGLAESSGLKGTPTGTVFNGGPGFTVSANGQTGSSLFLFATEDGLIAGWSPHVEPTHAIVAVDNSSAGATYKGLALDTDSTGRALLVATNFATGKIDVFDEHFQAAGLAGSFTDPNLPAGYAPFGIQNIDGRLYVTYAKQDASKHNDMAGAGNGFLDVFSGDGVLQQRLASQGPLNSPWGLALAPADFGEFSRDLLVGNFGDGHINVFEPNTGRFLGQLDDSQGNPITIDHLWGLEFGNGAGAGNTHTLFFNAGIDNQRHGLFGKLQSTQNIVSDAESNDAPAGNIYDTHSDTLANDASVGVQADQQDNYPLPPASGPTLRGDIKVQPRALPVVFPLRAASVDLAPTLLTVSEAPRVLASSQAPGALIAANAAGNGSDITIAPPSAGGSLGTGLGTANSSGGQKDAGAMSAPGALEIVLSLHTQPDLMARMTTTSEAPSGDKLPAADTVSSRTNVDPRYLWLQAANSLAAPAGIGAANRVIAEAMPEQDDLTPDPGILPGRPEQAAEAVDPMTPERRLVGHERALETTDVLTILLVTGGACLMLGVGHAARGTKRREGAAIAPTLHREHLLPGS